MKGGIAATGGKVWSKGSLLLLLLLRGVGQDQLQNGVATVCYEFHLLSMVLFVKTHDALDGK